MTTSTKVILALSAVVGVLWIDANVIGLGLGRINPLTPKSPPLPPSGVK